MFLLSAVVFSSAETEGFDLLWRCLCQVGDIQQTTEYMYSDWFTFPLTLKIPISRMGYGDLGHTLRHLIQCNANSLLVAFH